MDEKEIRKKIKEHDKIELDGKYIIVNGRKFKFKELLERDGAFEMSDLPPDCAGFLNRSDLEEYLDGKEIPFEGASTLS